VFLGGTSPVVAEGGGAGRGWEGVVRREEADSATSRSRERKKGWTALI